MSKNSPSSWDLKDSHLHSDCRIFEVYKQRFRRRSDGGGRRFLCFRDKFLGQCIGDYSEE